jgi:hypothetical protein
VDGVIVYGESVSVFWGTGSDPKIGGVGGGKPATGSSPRPVKIAASNITQAAMLKISEIPATATEAMPTWDQDIPRRCSHKGIVSLRRELMTVEMMKIPIAIAAYFEAFGWRCLREMARLIPTIQMMNIGSWNAKVVSAGISISMDVSPQKTWGLGVGD